MMDLNSKEFQLLFFPLLGLSIFGVGDYLLLLIGTYLNKFCSQTELNNIIFYVRVPINYTLIIMFFWMRFCPISSSGVEHFQSFDWRVVHRFWNLNQNLLLKKKSYLTQKGQFQSLDVSYCIPTLSEVKTIHLLLLFFFPHSLIHSLPNLHIFRWSSLWFKFIFLFVWDANRATLRLLNSI